MTWHDFSADLRPAALSASPLYSFKACVLASLLRSRINIGHAVVTVSPTACRGVKVHSRVQFLSFSFGTRLVISNYSQVRFPSLGLGTHLGNVRFPLTSLISLYIPHHPLVPTSLVPTQSPFVLTSSPLVPTCLIVPVCDSESSYHI
jgi:hypothetical protein